MNVQTPEGATEPLPCAFCQIIRTPVNQLMPCPTSSSEGAGVPDLKPEGASDGWTARGLHGHGNERRER
eukprot:7779053-Heterocapsa_arctica.AAC.1